MINLIFLLHLILFLVSESFSCFQKERKKQILNDKMLFKLKILSENNSLVWVNLSDIY